MQGLGFHVQRVCLAQGLWELGFRGAGLGRGCRVWGLRCMTQGEWGERAGFGCLGSCSEASFKLRGKESVVATLSTQSVSLHQVPVKNQVSVPEFCY